MPVKPVPGLPITAPSGANLALNPKNAKLQKLSAGQKILLRMGHANELKMEAKLPEIHEGLVSIAPASALPSHSPHPSS
jgi:hypothetical protein